MCVCVFGETGLQYLSLPATLPHPQLKDPYWRLMSPNTHTHYANDYIIT